MNTSLVRTAEVRERARTVAVAAKTESGVLILTDIDTFKRRLKAALAEVLTIWPQADMQTMESSMLTLMYGDRERTLRYATEEALVGFLLHAAQTRLAIGKELAPIVEMDALTRQSAIAPFETVAGLVRQMMQAGAKEVFTDTVYEGDVFIERFADGVRKFTHNRAHGGNRGPAVAYYAIVDRPNGEWHAKALTLAQIEQRRKESTWPDHPGWRKDYHQMAEYMCVHAIATWIPKGFQRPRIVTPMDEHVPRPLSSLDLDDPYATARHGATPAANTPDESADFDVREEPIFESVDDAASERLPGTKRVFWGFGGERIGDCPMHILEKTMAWIDASLDLQVRHARLRLAIEIVLLDRAATTPSSR